MTSTHNWHKLNKWLFSLVRWVRLHSSKGEQFFKGRSKYFAIVLKYLFQGERILWGSKFNVTGSEEEMSLVMRLGLTHYVKLLLEKFTLYCKSCVNCTSEPVGNWFCQLGIPSIKGQSHEITTVTICVLYNKVTKIFTSNYLHKAM